MNICSIGLFLIALCRVQSKECEVKCPEEDAEIKCGLNIETKIYSMFPSKCAMSAHKQCYNVELLETPLKFCVKSQSGRRMYGESCPVFCPNHYRPVCGASKLRSYMYRTFNNGCYLDMLNCRSDDEFAGYVEVPLEFCQRHAMKNIYKEQVVITNLHDYHEY